MERKAGQEMTRVAKIRRGLMLGRFQPFHRGHLALARQILQECDELVIAIGSAQFNFIEKDPFTAGERVLMIHRGLAADGLDLSRCYIIPVPNDDNNARWLAGLRSMLPEFDVLYTGNNYVMHLVARSQDGGGGSSSGTAITLRNPSFEKKSKYNGTHIRRLMLTGNKWRQMVPEGVATEIDRIKGVERLKVLQATGAESSPQSW